MRELQVRNLQRDRRVSSLFLRRVTRHLLEDELRFDAFEVVIHLVSAQKMAAINREFLQHEGSTDVITFDYRNGYSEIQAAKLDCAGEIFISVADAVAQAGEFGTNWQEELTRYIVHGVLHLTGHDDLVPAKRRKMKKEENRLVRRLSRSFPLNELER